MNANFGDYFMFLSSETELIFFMNLKVLCKIHPLIIEKCELNYSFGYCSSRCGAVPFFRQSLLCHSDIEFGRYNEKHCEVIY